MPSTNEFILYQLAKSFSVFDQCTFAAKSGSSLLHKTGLHKTLLKLSGYANNAVITNLINAFRIKQGYVPIDFREFRKKKF